MANDRNRYKQMEQYVTYALILNTVIFALYLLFAGLGIVWLKIIFSILVILLSILCLACLFITRELLRKRSLWMSVGAAALIVCTVFSLLLNYPGV